MQIIRQIRYSPKKVTDYAKGSRGKLLFHRIHFKTVGEYVTENSRWIYQDGSLLSHYRLDLESVVLKYSEGIKNVFNRHESQYSQDLNGESLFIKKHDFHIRDSSGTGSHFIPILQVIHVFYCF